MPLVFYAYAVVMGANISASRVTLNCSHMSFDVYNQNSPRFFSIQGSIEKVSEWYTLEGICNIS
jgi:hypothetical protein